MGISDSYSLRTADPGADGHRRGADHFSGDQVRDRDDGRGWGRVERTGRRERRCGGVLRRAQGWVALTATMIRQPRGTK